MRGYFISFCGLDGSGKTFHSRLLKDYFTNTLNKKTVLIPGYKPSVYYDNLKEASVNLPGGFIDNYTSDIVSMSLLCDLWDNTEKYIKPNLDMGNIVITERYWETSKIYAPILGSNKVFIEELIKLFPSPDVYIYLDCDPDYAFERIIERSKKENKPISPKEKIGIMREARNCYIEFVHTIPNCIILNTLNKDYNEIHNEIINKITKYLSL